jgi:hypothetical protein
MVEETISVPNFTEASIIGVLFVAQEEEKISVLPF